MFEDMTPCNRYVLVLPMTEKEEESTILVPDGYKPKTSSFVRVKVLDWANDTKLQISENAIAVVNGAMIEEIEFDGKKHHLVLENYILGFFR